MIIKAGTESMIVKGYSFPEGVREGLSEEVTLSLRSE